MVNINDTTSIWKRLLEVFRADYLYKAGSMTALCDAYRQGYEDAREKYDEDLKKNNIQRWRVSGHP